MTRAVYLLKDAFLNMRRHVLVVTGAVLAVFVSLALAFGAIIVNELVRFNTLQWQEGVHVIVFLKDVSDGVTTQAQEALHQEIQSWEEVKSTRYVDKSEAWLEFKEMFSSVPAFVENTDPGVLPPSIRIELADLDRYQEVQFRLIGLPAVRKVVSLGKAIESLTTVSSVLNRLGVLLALVQGAAAVVLISNTIRMAIYARREEVAVMKLVGASNWFIRVPFLIEGMFEGFVGAALAVGAVALGARSLGSVNSSISLLQLEVDWLFFVRWSVIFLFSGAFAGILGSALGLRRFLRV